MPHSLQLKPAYYSAYANHLASWGYAVVQYDTGRWPILNDRQEVLPLLTMLTNFNRLHTVASVHAAALLPASNKLA